MMKSKWIYSFCITALISLWGLSANATNTNSSNQSTELYIEKNFDPHNKKYKTVRGHKMAYIEVGEGRPIVFIHGNPTSSYLWRNIIPYVMDDYRVIAPDLIGMGDSDKPDIDYTYTDQITYLTEFLDSMNLEDAVLVIHDWGSSLGFHYARIRPEIVTGIAFMDAMVPPLVPFMEYHNLGVFEDFIRQLKTPGLGENLALENNFMVEGAIPGGVVKSVPEYVMQEYRRPYPTAESRKALLNWARSAPVQGKPLDSWLSTSANSRFVMESDIPKLALWASPGVLMTESVIDFLRVNMKNTEFVHIGEGTHFVQEDQPDNIGKALIKWLEEKQ